MKKNKKLYKVIIILFIVLNILNTYFVTTTLFNGFLVPFERNFWGEVNAVFGNLIILMTLLGLSLLIFKKRKHQLLMIVIITLLLNSAIYAMGVYIKFYNVAFEFSALDLFQNPGDGLGVSLILSALYDFIFEFRFISFIPFIVIFVLYLTYNKKIVEKRSTSSYIMLKRTLTSAIVVMSCLVINLVTFQVVIEENWNSNVGRTTFVSQNIGLYPFYVYQLAGHDFRLDFMRKYNQEQIEEFVDFFNTNTSNYTNIINGQTFSHQLTIDNLAPGIQIDSTLLNGSDQLNGILAERNLVLIHLESVSAYLYNLFPEFWPFLTKLLDESLVFTNFYHNTGVGISADAEFSVLTGLYPTGNTTLYWDFNRRPFFVESLPYLFNQANYFTQAVQADVENFYNRNIIYPELMKFDSFFTIDDFRNYYPDLNDIYDHQNPWVTDFGMTRVIRNQLETINDPMFLFTKTMMPHVPFQYNPLEEEGLELFSRFDWFDDLSAPTRRYLAYIPYIDQVIKSFFFDILTGENQTNTNTAFLFYGDHNASINPRDMRIFFEDPNMTRMQMQNHNLQAKAFLYVPGETINEFGVNQGLIRGTQSLVRSQVDVFRTVVELFGLETNTPYFGTNLLSNEPGFSIGTRFFAVATNTHQIGRISYDKAVFLLGDPRVVYGDYSMINNEFRKRMQEKKIMMNVWIQTSMLRDVGNWR